MFSMMSVNVIYDRKQILTAVNIGIDDYHRLQCFCVINLIFQIR